MCKFEMQCTFVSVHSGAYEGREGASNYHTLVSPILCWI